MTPEDFYLYCFDGRSGDVLCCPVKDCHWQHDIEETTFSRPELGSMLRVARDHLEGAHNDT